MSFLHSLLRRIRLRPRLSGRGRGRVLAVKWGYNPNSSSLGVDVTFLLFGLSILTLLTPLIGLALRLQRRRPPLPLRTPPASPDPGRLPAPQTGA